MKNENLYWGYKKIQGELLKLQIHSIYAMDFFTIDTI